MSPLIVIGLPTRNSGFNAIGPVEKEIKSPSVYNFDDARDIQALAALERLVEL